MNNNISQEQRIGLILAVQLQKETDTILWELLNKENYHGCVDIWYEFNQDKLTIDFKKVTEGKTKTNDRCIRYLVNQQKKAVKILV